ncbi:MAG: hypothetical protein C5B49_15820 [Bdellovibrio sp.]|nr:MAG: hypothetical protein C5B49_15820 [Bdellovibrio sp.]
MQRSSQATSPRVKSSVGVDAATGFMAPLTFLCLCLFLFLFVGWTAPAMEHDSRSWQEPANSPTGAKNYKNRVEKMTESRWTLKDWLDQKERNRMMDLWLGMYAPSPYEFILSVSQMDYQEVIDNPASQIGYKSIKGSAAFYALVLGLEVDYENNWDERYNDLLGMLNVRVAGNSNQSTHLNVGFGLRSRNGDPNVQILGQSVAGAELEIYIEHHSGIRGSYRYDLPKTDPVLGTVSGHRAEAGVFFEILNFRFFGNWFTEDFDNMISGNATNRTRTGWQYGLKTFF